MAKYEQYLEAKNSVLSPQEIFTIQRDITDLAKEIFQLRMMLWLSHGHTGMYGDDGEMQCSQCAHEFGFWDWKRTDVKEIRSKIEEGNLRKILRGGIII